METHTSPSADAADMAQALRAVQQVVGAPGFAELSAGQESRAAAAADPERTLQVHGIMPPPAIQRVEVKRRHTTRLAWARGARGGGVEWRFHVQTGGTTFRIIYLCDPWPEEDPVAGEPPASGSA